MEGNGPANGTKKKSGVLLVSEDCFALDIVAANIMGYDTLKLAFVKELLSRKINPFPINQKGIPKLKINFKKPIDIVDRVPKVFKRWIMKRLIKDPFIVDSKCKRCLVCVNHCPAKTIKEKKEGSEKHIVIDISKCIHCFCCHELCPHDAIKLRHRSIFNRFKKSDN
jgi:formate hydrogenlyase subunit 6/NADH:ubiquinone oxidoreductase subunit I